MSPGRRTPSKAAKRVLLAGAAFAVLWGPAVHAQAPSPKPAKAANATGPSADGLQPGELYMEADQVIRDDNAKVTTAEGSVEVRYDGRTLRADRLIYEESKVEGGQGVMRARGHVQIINDDGSIQYADDFVLDDEMKAGVALGFSARLQQNVKIAAASAVRRNETVMELNRAIYTPCEICSADGKPKRPTWSISADRVVQNKAKRIVYYRNARIRILGVPLLYLPIFWHADPQSERASGFLVPRISASDRRGMSYEQPYYWAISPYSDLIVSPQVNTKVNPFLNGQARKRFYSGDVDLRFGYTHDRDFDSQGKKFGDDTSRSYILGRGSFRAGEYWRWGFTAERASDDLIFDKYEVGNVYEARGPYIADDRRLISQAYALRQDRSSYGAIAAMSVQSLRPGDNDRTFPTVAPLAEVNYDLPTQVFGGRLRARSSAVALYRDQSPDNQSLRLPGIDSQRATGELDWRSAYTSSGGFRLEPFVNARVDAYHVSDITSGTSRATSSKSLTRGLAVAGAYLSYPVYRRFKTSTVVLEPLAQVAVSPDAKQVVIGRNTDGSPVYLNEDSLAFEFDENTLFRPNKFPGFDLYEDGARLNVAGRASVLWDDGRRGSLLVGRSFRTQDNDVFSARSGLRGKSSDWIVAATVEPRPGVSGFVRTRLDGDTLDVHRLEAGANLNTKRGNGYVRYFKDDSEVNLTDGSPFNDVARENLDLGGELYVGKNWGVSAYGSRDLAQEGWVVRDIGVFYRDDCLRIDVIYRREDTVIGRLGPSESVGVRLTLATLGGPLNGR